MKHKKYIIQITDYIIDTASTECTYTVCLILVDCSQLLHVTHITPPPPKKKKKKPQQNKTKTKQKQTNKTKQKNPTLILKSTYVLSIR